VSERHARTVDPDERAVRMFQPCPSAQRDSVRQDPKVERESRSRDRSGRTRRSFVLTPPQRLTGTPRRDPMITDSGRAAADDTATSASVHPLLPANGTNRNTPAPAAAAPAGRTASRPARTTRPVRQPRLREPLCHHKIDRLITNCGWSIGTTTTLSATRTAVVRGSARTCRLARTKPFEADSFVSRPSRRAHPAGGRSYPACDVESVLRDRARVCDGGRPKCSR
jgi:hypothetical protein